ncbi:alpha/beta fold hydrolase [Streptomyces roseirectus]|uniref:Alpha/beta fold hydrolase n=1 Tax=Streptomyces roseirectus TaxID=2768066 RepID=A0A7H0INU9_9ACTN|nr:alpha/beta fold hydrolase [Streptomyces roseirectus]QNP74465.1 alpha/beta fold hydrolase [Streptomyces roseirectus]
MTTTQQLQPPTPHSTTPRSRPRFRALRIAARVLLTALGILLAPVTALAAAWGTATLTPTPWLLAAAALTAAAVTCALLAYAGTRSRPGTALITAATLTLTCGAAALTVLKPLDEPPPVPRAEPTGYWTLDTGSRLAYTRLPARGTPRTTPVIMLHGGPGTPGDGPDATQRMLAGRGYDVYSYDQVGAGRSTRLKDPTGYTVARQVADLEAVRKRIGADQVVLMGASWGATLAAEYLAAHPDRVERMVLTSPGVLWAPAWQGRDEGDIWDRLTPELQARIDELEASPRLVAWSLLMAADPRAAHAVVGDAEIDPVFAKLLTIAAPAATCHPERPLTDLPGSLPGFYANQLTAEDQSRVPDPRPALRRTDVPVLVVRGACDYKDPGIAREYDEVLPDSTLVTVEGAGHLVDLERPAQYRRAVAGFLDRLD